MDLRTQRTHIDAGRTDGELARGAIAGDADAFEGLYRRHAEAAWRVAQAVATTREDAADAVSEAFTRMLRALADGRLRPDIAFRPYLLATTRNAAIDQYRYRARFAATSDTAEPSATGLTPAEKIVDTLDAGLVSDAFRDLPERWRSVLWLTEVEGMPVREVGDRLGLSANGTAQLARRARSGLRERYLRAHLRTPIAAACAAAVAELGAYLDGALTPSATAQIDQHLAACEQCAARAAELGDVGSTLRAVALPIPAGLAALSFARYRLAFSVAEHSRKSLMMLGELDLTRPLTIATTSLLALGVIAAGLMSGSGGPSPVAGSRSGGAVGSPPTILTQLAGSAGPGATGPATGGPGAALTLAISLGATSGPGASGSTAALPAPATGPGQSGGLLIPPSPGPGQPNSGGSSGGSGGTDALLQVELGANLGGTSTSASVGVGGGCTGVSVNGSASCAPTAPSSTGINLGLNSPLGPIVVAVPPASGAGPASDPAQSSRSASAAAAPHSSAARATATTANAAPAPKQSATTKGSGAHPLVSVKVGGLSISV